MGELLDRSKTIAKALGLTDEDRRAIGEQIRQEKSEKN